MTSPAHTYDYVTMAQEALAGSLTQPGEEPLVDQLFVLGLSLRYDHVPAIEFIVAHYGRERLESFWTKSLRQKEWRHLEDLSAHLPLALLDPFWALVPEKDRGRLRKTHARWQALTLDAAMPERADGASTRPGARL